MAGITSYSVGQSLYIALEVVDMHDLCNVILIDQSGRRHLMLDTTIKSSALAPSATGVQAADTGTTTPVTTQAQGDAQLPPIVQP